MYSRLVVARVILLVKPSRRKQAVELVVRETLGTREPAARGEQVVAAQAW
jgi:hypothetical protein